MPKIYSIYNCRNYELWQVTYLYNNRNFQKTPESSSIITIHNDEMEYRLKECCAIQYKKGISPCHHYKHQLHNIKVYVRYYTNIYVMELHITRVNIRELENRKYRIFAQFY